MISPFIYFGNIDYFHWVNKDGKLVFDGHENFIKQSQRNRTSILGANGVLNLSVPILGGKDTPTPVKDIKIAYHEKWYNQHWRSILSAYKSAPFFDYYAQELEVIIFSKPEFLQDLCSQTFTWATEALELDIDVSYSKEYIEKESIEDSTTDYRILAKKNTNPFIPSTYNQVFSEKTEFQANLSIIDLIFNEGPNALSFL